MRGAPSSLEIHGDSIQTLNTKTLEQECAILNLEKKTLENLVLR